MPNARVGQIRKCQKALHIGLKQVLHRHLTHLESCAEDLMRCELKNTYTLFSPAAYADCTEKASRWCDRVRITRDRMVPHSVDRIKVACDDIPFGDMTSILGFSDIATACGATTVNEVIDCLVPKVKCIAWDSERFVEARMSEDVPAAHLADYLTCGN
jgi:hypothetical protein